MDMHTGHDTMGHDVGVHGLLVAGGWRTGSRLRGPVYVSHLPMFTPPHDFQIIARVAGPAAGTFGDFAAHFGQFEVYTFRPEPFPIHDLDPAGGPKPLTIKGSLFRGHFERGGSLIAEDTELEVEEVLHFRRLTKDAESPAGGIRYLCFGEPEAALVAHLITAAPDFDQILQAGIRTGIGGVDAADLRAGITIEIPARANAADDRLHEGETVAATPAGGGSVELVAGPEVYLETGDLERAGPAIRR